jgi:two-component sensor histidine kinase
VDPVGLDMDTAMPCGLLINEIVSNSYKHAFPGENTGVITIDFHRNDGLILLKIKDNGVGLPANIDVTATETLGMQLIQALTGQLDGNLDVERDNGTCFSVVFGYPKV